jgi:hypothetical protein
MVSTTPSNDNVTSDVLDVKVTDSRREYDLTDTCCQVVGCLTCPLHFLPLCPGFLGKKTLILEDEEVFYHVRGCVYNVNTRRPYGELGSVDLVNCFCCSGLSSSIFRGMIICPGSGCNKHDEVDEVVMELKRRMKNRGDTGNIRRIETALVELRALRGEVGEIKENMNRLMSAMNVAPVEETMARS